MSEIIDATKFKNMIPINDVKVVIQYKIEAIKVTNSYRGKVNQVAQFAIEMLESVLREIESRHE